jgi:oxygen-independent coproporphyrinogen-3 oxidase
MVLAIKKELALKKDILGSQKINTIYFGGGTPSLLNYDELKLIMDEVYAIYNCDEVSEITLEANPDDVNTTNINNWKKVGVNRISLGVQSFFNDDLKQMNRAHDSNQAHEAIKLLRENNITNISVDFMFALPLLTTEQLEKNLQFAINYKIPHISCYNLTLEEQTALVRMIKEGSIENLSEDKSIEQFQFIMDKLGSNKYHQYEISNYALEGYKSQHNSAYWAQKPYIGIGPSAHSFYNSCRSANISNNTGYMKGVENETEYFEIENLTDSQFFNEFILTRLRTSKGICNEDLKILFPQYIEAFREATNDFIRNGDMAYFGDEYRLMPQGKLIADHIASELFVI